MKDGSRKALATLVESTLGPHPTDHAFKPQQAWHEFESGPRLIETRTKVTATAVLRIVGLPQGVMIRSEQEAWLYCPMKNNARVLTAYRLLCATQSHTGSGIFTSFGVSVL